MKNSLQKVLVMFVVSLLILGGVNAQKKIVYLYDKTKGIDSATMEHPEMSVANFITAIGGYEVYMFGTPNLNNCTQQQLDTLRNADLIVIGRGIGSANWNAKQDSIWNLLTTPVLCLNMYAMGGAKMKWFDGTEDYGTSIPPRVKVNVPGDAVFAGLTLSTGDTLDFWEGKWNALKLNSAGAYVGGGTIMASFTNALDVLNIIYARFSPGIEFYTLGAPLKHTDHIPRGYRTFVGMGQDNGGKYPYNYFGFTDNSKEVLKKEIARLLAFDKPTVGIKNVNASVLANVYLNKANLVVEMAKLNEVKVLDITGKLVKYEKANGQEINVNISNLKAGVYIVKAIDSNKNSVAKKIVKK